MTVVEAEPLVEAEGPSGSTGTSPYWWVGLIVMVTAMVVAAVAFAGSIINEPTQFTGTNVAVTVADFRVSMPRQLSAGTKTLQIANHGGTQHELLVFHPDATIDPNHLPLGDDGNIVEDAPGVNLISDGDNIDPGQGQTRALDLSQPGTYVFLCNLPQHYGQGMALVVTVR